RHNRAGAKLEARAKSTVIPAAASPAGRRIGARLRQAFKEEACDKPACSRWCGHTNWPILTGWLLDLTAHIINRWEAACGAVQGGYRTVRRLRRPLCKSIGGKRDQESR